MSPWLFALFNKSRVQVTVGPLTANTSWVAPFTTSNIDTAIGKGAAGTPSDPGTYTTHYIDYLTRRSDGGVETLDGGTTTSTGLAPADYCDPVQSEDSSTVYSSSQRCYQFTQNYSPSSATTGASTTAFGKTFPGGTGGAATNTTFTNIAVTPGGSYNIVVPSGGSLTFTYWK
jgi:hypothetical protein